MQAQKLLGDKGLSVNPRKTHGPGSIDDVATANVDKVKAELLKMRRVRIHEFSQPILGRPPALSRQRRSGWCTSSGGQWDRTRRRRCLAERSRNR